MTRLADPPHLLLNTCARVCTPGRWALLAPPLDSITTSQEGDLVIVDYIGYLSDGRVFDSSTSPGRKPLAIQIGKNTVIPGLEEAVLGMRQGGQRVVIVPPALGYGDRGVCLGEAGGDCLVPPNSIIEYDLTLRRVSPSPI